jgi:hypothetical protein
LGREENAQLSDFEGDSVDTEDMSDSTDLLERMLRDVYPPKLEAEVEEWIRKLYEGSAGEPGLARRYWWLRNLFRAAAENEADIDEMMNETVFKYLGPVKSALWAAAAGHLIKDEDTLMPAVRRVAEQLGRPVREVFRECIYEHQHEELIDRFYGIDMLTQEDLEDEWRRERILSEQFDSFVVATGSKPAPGIPVDPERLAYESPKAMINSIAKNVLIDHFRKLETKQGTFADADLSSIANESPDANPDARLMAREAHSQYLAGLTQLPPIQRAAWILCRDPLLLSDAEAEALLRPALSGPQAELAVKQRPMSIEDASRLFGRDVSPDAAKAAKKLASLLNLSASPRRAH